MCAIRWGYRSKEDMKEDIPPLETQPNFGGFDRLREVVLGVRQAVGRVAAASLLVTGGGLTLFSLEAVVDPTVAHADTTTYSSLSYPWKDAPCEFGASGGSTCLNPNDPKKRDKYDWGEYDSNNVFQPYRNGYEYRNCVDYVQWKEGTEGVVVPRGWGNGGDHWA